MPPPKLLRKKGGTMLTEIRKKKGFSKACLRGLFSHIGLLLIVSLYAVIGAYVLIDMEKEEEGKRIETKLIAAENLKSSKDYIVSHAWYQSTQDIDQQTFKALVTKNLDMYHKFIVQAAKYSYYDGKPNEWNYDWTFSKSLLFTSTTMGAIGYGHIAPKTKSGQFFTVYYGMIGVPLLLLFLANIGEFLANSLRYIYSRLCCRWCRIRRVLSELKSKKKLTRKILWKDEVGHEPYMPTNHVDVPIVINLCVIFVYLMLGGALFSYWENWEMHSAAYFTFITLTTIGFGDYVPGNSFTTGGDKAFINSMKMIVTIVFCMFGMALLSMAINLMQEQLRSKFKWLAHELGINQEEPDSSWKYNIKKHDPETVFETPEDKNGNQTKLLNVVDDRDLGKKKAKKNKNVKPTKLNFN